MVANILVCFLSAQLFNSTTKPMSQASDLSQKENVMLELRETRPSLCNNEYVTSKYKQFLIYHSAERDASIEKEQKWLAWHFGKKFSDSKKFLPPPLSYRLQRVTTFVLFYHVPPCTPNSSSH